MKLFLVLLRLLAWCARPSRRAASCTASASALLLVLLLAGGGARELTSWAPTLATAVACAVAVPCGVADPVAAGGGECDRQTPGQAAFRPAPRWQRQRQVQTRGLPPPRAPDA